MDFVLHGMPEKLWQKNNYNEPCIFWAERWMVNQRMFLCIQKYFKSFEWNVTKSAFSSVWHALLLLLFWISLHTSLGNSYFFMRNDEIWLFLECGYQTATEKTQGNRKQNRVQATIGDPPQPLCEVLSYFTYHSRFRLVKTAQERFPVRGLAVSTSLSRHISVLIVTKRTISYPPSVIVAWV